MKTQPEGARGELQLGQIWDDAAEGLHLDPMRSVRYHKCVRYIADLDRASKVVEIGCGEGSGLKLLQTLGFRRVCGLEVSLNRLRQTREQVGEETPLALISAMGGLPLQSESVDAVVSAAVIEHVISPENFVREITRVLRPGGRAVISSDCYAWRLLQIMGIYRSVQPIDKAIFPITLFRYFRECGLQVVGYEGFPLPGAEYRFLRLLLGSLVALPVMAVKKILPRGALERVRERLGKVSGCGGAGAVRNTTRGSWNEKPIPAPGMIAFLRLIFSDENVFFVTKRSG